jgi:hypothetical protein
MNSIVGTWKLVGASAADANGNPPPEPYDQPMRGQRRRLLAQPQ